MSDMSRGRAHAPDPVGQLVKVERGGSVAAGAVAGERLDVLGSRARDEAPGAGGLRGGRGGATRIRYRRLREALPARLRGGRAPRRTLEAAAPRDGIATADGRSVARPAAPIAADVCMLAMSKNDIDLRAEGAASWPYNQRPTRAALSIAWARSLSRAAPEFNLLNCAADQHARDHERRASEPKLCADKIGRHRHAL